MTKYLPLLIYIANIVLHTVSLLLICIHTLCLFLHGRKIVIKIGKKKKRKPASSEESDDDPPPRHAARDDDFVRYLHAH